MAILSWALRRQLLYFGGGVVFLAFVIGIPALLVSYSAPTCFDKKQNQGEEGVDCGGPCALLCKAVAENPIVHWQRPFPVVPGVWSAVAYVENPNTDSAVARASYRIKLYDADNLLVAEREGVTRIPRRSTFAVFEGGIETGTRQPVRALFEFLEPLAWERTDEDEPKLRVENPMFTDTPTPRLESVLLNETLAPLRDIEVVVILYDITGNALASSKTALDRIESRARSTLVFTWPLPFGAEVGRTEFLTRVLTP